MSSDENQAPEPGEEEEIVVNMIETPRGRVPEFDSTFRALERISARLLEQDEKIENLASKLTAGGQISPSQLREILNALEAVRSEVASLNQKFEQLLDGLEDIRERLDLLDYLADIVERYLKAQED